MSKPWKLLQVISMYHQVKSKLLILIVYIYSDQYGNLQDPIDSSQLQKLKFIKHSTKATWLVAFLKKLLSADPTDKIVVVSQVERNAVYIYAYHYLHLQEIFSL